jgi:hypothetical protein
MAKHAALSHEQRMPLSQLSQELEGGMHKKHCKPRHSTGGYSYGEDQTRISYEIAKDNIRQGRFYQKNDRTEDARPDVDYDYINGDPNKED